jgi:hypothetical protein
VKKEIFTIRKKIQPYKNLIPPFIEWSLHAESVIVSDYKLMVSASAPNRFNKVRVKCLPSTNMSVFGVKVGNYLVEFFTIDGTLISSTTANVNNFVTPSNAEYVGLVLYNDGVGTYSFENFIMVEGTYTEIDFVVKDDGVISERLKDNGQVQEVRVRFYPGVERTLQVSPYVLHKNNRREDFFTYPEGTEPYITGDNDYLIFPCSLDFQYDDEICIEYNHAGGDFPYTLAVDVVVTYHEAEVIA